MIRSPLILTSNGTSSGGNPPPRLVYPHRTAEIYRVLPSDLHRWVTWFDGGGWSEMGTRRRFTKDVRWWQVWLLQNYDCGFRKTIKVDLLYVYLIYFWDMLWWGVVIGWLGDGFNVFVFQVLPALSLKTIQFDYVSNEWPNHHLDLECSSLSHTAKVISICFLVCTSTSETIYPFDLLYNYIYAASNGCLNHQTQSYLQGLRGRWHRFTELEMSGSFPLETLEFQMSQG